MFFLGVFGSGGNEAWVKFGELQREFTCGANKKNGEKKIVEEFL